MFPSFHRSLHRFVGGPDPVLNDAVQLIMLSDRILNDDDPNAKLQLYFCANNSLRHPLIDQARQNAASLVLRTVTLDRLEEHPVQVCHLEGDECPFTFRTDFLAMVFLFRGGRIHYVNSKPVNLGFVYSHRLGGTAVLRDNNGMEVNGVLLLPQNEEERCLAQKLYDKEVVLQIKHYFRHRLIKAYEYKIMDSFEQCYK